MNNRILGSRGARFAMTVILPVVAFLGATCSAGGRAADFGSISAEVAADAAATALLEPELSDAYPLLGDDANLVTKDDLVKHRTAVKFADPAAATQLNPMHHLLRLRNTSFDDFAAFVRDGQPLVVDDLARGWPMVGFTCDDFKTHFPSGNMKAEYSWVEKGDGRTALGDKKWINRPRRSGQEEHPERAQHAPYIWHVKDEEPLATKRAVQAMYQAPYFLNDTVNRAEFMDSMEFWLSPNGAGAMAHADSYCEPTWSVQLHGAKRWRMMSTLPTIDTVFDRFVYFDAGIYKVDKWAPDYEFVVQQGQGVLFPPGNFHETVAQKDQCVTATTVQMQLPNPTRYIRRFLNRLTSSHLGIEEACYQRWDGYATLQPRQAHASTTPPTLDEATWAARVAALGRELDADDDGRIGKAELEAHFLRKEATAWGRVKEFW